tara:strand:+ start:224 stop:745 length:522 start_codon:yes stop_codon:yes gene_type:complete
MQTNRIREQYGFTLIEVIVALGIFSIIALMAVGATLTILNTHNQLRDSQALINSLNYSLEAMSRDVRFGEIQSADLNEITVRKIEEGDEVTISYHYLNNDEDTKKIVQERNGVIREITPDGVDIESFKVFVTGVGGNDSLHPKTTILLSGRISGNQENISFALQTTVSQRIAE